MKPLIGAAIGVAALALLVIGGPALGAQTRYQPGVFVATSDGPVELTAYAVQAATGVREISRDGRIGILRMEHGSLESAPVVADVRRVLVNLPNHYPASVMAATTAFFSSERAERRDLPLGIQRLGMWTFDVRAADLEEPGRVTRLLEAVQASEDTPGDFFVVVGGHETMPRFYPFRVR